MSYKSKAIKLKGTVDKAHVTRGQLTQSLTVRNQPKEETAYARHARALREDRLIRRFEQLDSESRREAVRLAIDTGNRELMHAVVSEVGLVDESTAQRINLELMAGADRDGFSRLEQLVGKHDYSGKPDPFTGALPVTEYAVDSAIPYFDKEANAAANAGSESDADIRSRLTRGDGSPINGAGNES